ncbi:hypothetical protein WR25_21045 isoform B [Diploscapter pachys]|uniref:Thioredoxin domain-containing protein n=1 Tax=Diploscapter pachys TaxID=2018661 RepID=A0A2A2KRZ7_9BILA|nr:hypothetical protein WR25_21045 isoform A [Diploscapter pachys]PAV76721.1 hypothetical protein WR25_21045 isoform B [Diploscapter pachys]
MWFINFYSTYCSHCHQLAPTWRKFAREIEGTIRIGAVNCAEDVHLCQSQRVNAYPSLVFYPTGEFYQGHREVEYLTDFVMQRLQSEVLHLDRGNIDSLSKEFEPYNKRAWVIDFCDEMEACMSSINRRKLAAMLDKLANVGTIDCISRKKLCTRLGHSEGTYYYPAGQIDEENGRALESLDPQEIVAKVISFLPNLEAVEDNELEQLFGPEAAQQPIAVWFVPNGKAAESRPEYKKLPTMIDDIRIVYADCAEFTEICAQHLDVSKLPQFVVFKTSGGYEIDYVNKPGLYDVVAFIREAAVSPLHVLDDVAYNSAINSGELWIVDYFAPWCPPCLKLIGEYRRLHAHIAEDSNMANLKVGTIDCQKYAQICSHNGVQSYPTSVLYTPEGKTHRIVGYHHQQQIIEFVDNALNPSVQELNEIDFETYVLNKRDDETWIVDFFAPWCGPCQQLAPEYQRAARSLKSHKEDKIIMASVDCQAHPQLCKSQKVNSYPTIRLYPAKGGKQKRSNSYDYPNHMWRNSDSIQRWVFGLLPSNVVTLGNDFWTTVLDSDTPWMVDFFAPWCGHCIQFAPTYERLAKVL